MPRPDEKTSGLTERQQKWFTSVREGLERDTGKSFDEWVRIAKKCPETKQRAREKWLKEKYGLGVNRAATILDAAFPETGLGWGDPDALVAALWKEEGLKAVYERVEKAALALGGVTRGARKGYTAFSRKVQFAAARPHKGVVRLGLAVPPSADKRLEAAKTKEGWSERLKSTVTLTKPADVDAGLKALLQSAWEAS